MRQAVEQLEAARDNKADGDRGHDGVANESEAAMFVLIRLRDAEFVRVHVIAHGDGRLVLPVPVFQSFNKKFNEPAENEDDQNEEEIRVHGGRALLPTR